MADRAKIRNKAINRKTEKLRRSLAWADVASAFQAATPQQKESFAAAIFGDNPRKSWDLLNQILGGYLATKAATDVDAALADDSLTLEEIEDLLL